MLTLTVVFILLAYIIWKWWIKNKEDNTDEPPSFPGSLPLIGHLHLAIGNSKNLWKFTKDISDETTKAGGVISLHNGPVKYYAITDPDYYLLVANTCLQKDKFYKFGKPMYGEGLVTADLPIWKVHRRLLNPAFNHILINGYLETFNKQSRRLVKDLDIEVGKGPFDHYVYTQRISLETICLTALGVDFRWDSQKHNEYMKASDETFNIIIARFQKFWLHFDFIYNWSTLKKKQDTCAKILHDFSNSVLKERKAIYLNDKQSKQIKDSTSGKTFKTLMDLLLELAIDEGVFNDQQIREHIDTTIVAGYDTTATALMFVMLLIGSYPDVQQRVVEELHAVFGDDDRDVTKQDLSQLVYLEAVIKESIRFYPILPVVVRCLDSDIKLPHCTLKKGRPCILSVYGVHRHPVWGPDAEEFKPERWLDRATLPENPNAFAGYSLGKRFCIAFKRHYIYFNVSPVGTTIHATGSKYRHYNKSYRGKVYASMSIKVSLVHVFRNYKVSGDRKQLETRIDVLLKPVSGHHVTIERRLT